LISTLGVREIRQELTKMLFAVHARYLGVPLCFFFGSVDSVELTLVGQPGLINKLSVDVGVGIGQRPQREMGAVVYEIGCWGMLTRIDRHG